MPRFCLSSFGCPWFRPVRAMWLRVSAPLATAFLSLTTLGAPAQSQGPVRVADINTGGGLHDVEINWAEPFEDKVIFRAYSPLVGEELWITEGTPGTTELIADIQPGRDDGVTSGSRAWFAGELYFRGDDNEHGTELWRTDGTQSGTEMVVDLVPGSEGSGASGFTATDSHLFFNCHTKATGAELCVYDGTSVTVVDISAGPESSYPRNLTAVGPDLMCFSANLPDSGFEPWCSSGAGSTAMVADIASGSTSSDPQYFAAVGDSGILMSASTDSAGRELVRADLDSPDFTVLDLNSGSTSSDPEELIAIDGAVLFHAETVGEGRELHAYLESSVAVIALTTQPGPEDGMQSNSFPVSAPDGKTAYFAAQGDGDGYELWTSDGTVGGTKQVLDLVDGADSSTPRGFVATEDRLFFGAATTELGFELHEFEFDSSEAIVHDLRPGIESSNVRAFAAQDQFVVFRAGLDDSNLVQTYALPTSTRGAVADPLIAAVPWSNSSLSLLTPALGGVAFRAIADTFYEPFFFDGTMLTQLADLIANDKPTSAQEFAGTDDWLAFAGTSSLGRELYLWDGVGSLQLVEFQPGPGSGSPERLTWLPSRLLTIARANVNSGPQSVYSVVPATGTFEEFLLEDPSILDSDGSHALLEADGGSIYLTDGLSATTVHLGAIVGPIRDGRILRSQAHPMGFLAVIYTRSGDLYGTDGTAASLEQINLTTSPGEMAAWGIPAVQGRSLFAVEDSEDGFEDYWLTDGTVAGTFRVFDRDATNRNSAGVSNGAVAVGNGWMISDDTPTTGREVWFLDPLGNLTEIDLAPGLTSSRPDLFGVLEGRAVFVAYTVGRGREFWISDGSVVGTEPLPEMLPGPPGDELSGEISTVAGHTIYFRANGPNGDGPELWALDRGRIFADGFEDGDLSSWH